MCYLNRNKEFTLSRREIECIQLLFEGHSAKHISRILRISHRTVEGHFNKIRKKLGCPIGYRLNKWIETIDA